MGAFLAFWWRTALLVGATFAGGSAGIHAQAGHPPAALGFGVACAACLALWLHARPSTATGGR